jgi:hypothetical protein
MRSVTSTCHTHRRVRLTGDVFLNRRHPASIPVHCAQPRWESPATGAAASDPHLDQIARPETPSSGLRFGDQAAASCWSRASYLLDNTYLTCPNRPTGSIRYRSAFRSMCAPGSRKLPLYLDSGAYRESVKTAPAWSSYRRYCQAVDLIQPDGAMARDVLDDQTQSLEGYRRLCSDGYDPTVIPVWQVRPGWDLAGC